jgi:hypothetical protein
MMIVGFISTKDEAEEIEQITKCFLIGKRARFIAHQH